MPAAPPPRFARKVLVLYAPADEAFARGYLAAALGLPLEPEPADGNDACAAAAEDNAIGLALSSRELSERPVSELGRLVATSQLVLPVLTPSFLADPWLQLSDQLASHLAVDDGDATAGVVPILLADCEAPLHLRAHVTLDFRQPGDWDDELARLRAHLERPAAAAVELPCPYPGMRPFRADDAVYFHGRDEEIEAVAGRLADGARELYVLGPSGSGKSSLVAAGVVPRLLAKATTSGRAMIVRTMRPGAAPTAALLAALAPARADPLHQVEDALAALLLLEPAAELLVVVDQSEELFSQADAAAQRQFASAVGAVRAVPRARLLFTARADFFAELLASDLWIEGSKQHFDLSPMRGEMLRQAIERPARKLGVHVEPALVDRLLADAADEPGALPLLQETLVHLWSRRRQRLLALDEYRAMGSGGRSGLAIALAARADQTLASLSRAQQVIARRALLRMVTFGEGHPHTRRRQPRSALRDAEAAADFDAALRALADSRLIILDREPSAERGAGPGEDGVRAELCHDMLITAWPSFARWVEARRADEQRRRQLQDHAADWVARGRGASGLLDETELAVALAWRHSEAARELGESPELTDMIAASHRALGEQRRRRRRRVRLAIGGLALFTAVSLALTGWAMRERGEAERQGAQARSSEQLAITQRRRSEAMLASQYQDSARRLILEGHPLRAISYLIAARDRQEALRADSGDEETAEHKNLRFLFRAAAANAPLFSLPHPGRLTYAEISDAAQLVATGGQDGAVRLWDAQSGLPKGAPLHHPALVRRILFAPDGARMAVVCSDGSLHLWGLRGAAPVDTVLASGEKIRVAIFSPDGRELISGAESGEVQRWDAASAAPLGDPLRHGRAIFGLEMSPDGARLAVVPIQTKDVTVWTLSPRPRAERLGTEMANVATASFSPDGKRLAVSYLGVSLVTIHEFGAAGQPARSSLVQHTETTLGVFFLAERTLLVTEHQVVLDAATPTRAISLPERILSASLVEGGGALILWCDDSSLRAVDTATGEVLAKLDVPFSTERTVMTSDGRRVLFVPQRDRVTMWRLEPRRQVRLAIEDNTLGAAFSPDGKLLAVTSFAGVRLWDPHRAKRIGTFSPPRTSMARHVRFSPDGHTLAMLAWDREVNLCSMEELRCRTLAPGWMNPDTLPADAAVPFDFSPDGGLLAAAISADAVQLWDPIHAGRRGPPLVHSSGAADPKRRGLTSVSFSRDGGRLLIAGDDGSATIWDVATQRLLGRVRQPSGQPLSSAAWRGDGQRLATTSFDGSGALWDARTLELIAPLDHEQELLAAAFSPDGKQLATHGKDGTLRLWDAQTGALRRILRLNDWVLRFAFTADSARFLTVSGGRAQLWDAVTGEPLTPPLQHPLQLPERASSTRSPPYLDAMERESHEWIRGAVLSPDGRELLTIGMRSEARLWDVGLDERSLDEWRALQTLNPFDAPAPP